jgi:hypothetical protein
MVQGALVDETVRLMVEPSVTIACSRRPVPASSHRDTRAGGTHTDEWIDLMGEELG